MAQAELSLFILMSLVSASLQGNYDPKTDGVVELTLANFKTLVLNSNDPWLVIFEFSGPGCKPCIDLSVIVKQAVPILKEKKISVGFVDSMTPGGAKLAKSYAISSYPVTLIFGNEKSEPVKYPFTPKSAQDLVNAIDFELKRPSAAEGQCGKDSAENPNSATYELTDENFEEVVLKCEEPWIINFYDPHNNLCIQFTPYYEAAAKEFKGRVKFGSIFLLGSKVAKKYGVKYVCTVKLFPKGDKSGAPLDYNNGNHGPGINADLISWIKNTTAASLPAPGINELTSQSVLDSKCKNSGVSSCVFFFFPKPDKCNADCQRPFLDQLKLMADEMKAENWAWFLTTEGKQTAFEQTLGIQIFPGISAVELESKTFSTNRGTTTVTKLKEFLQSYANGRLPSKSLPSGGFPTVKA